MADEAITTPRRIVIATGNLGKLRELQQLLGDTFDLVPQAEFDVPAVEETGSTFLENALLKARHASAAAQLPAIADDSGLEVDELDGAPGVRSARFAGPDATDADNNALLLKRLESVADAGRGARFRSVIVFVADPDDPEPVVAEGAWEGRLLRAPRGTGGFGYDPLFLDPDTGLTGGELDPADKNRRSHRGQAARLLRRRLMERR